MLSLKKISRKISLKYAQTFRPTLISPIGNDSATNIPRAPRIPVEFADFGDVMPKSQVNERGTDSSGYMDVEEDDLMDPTSSELTSSMPTIRPEALENAPEWKKKLTNALTSMYHSNLITGIYHSMANQKVNAAQGPEDVADIKKQMIEDTKKAEKDAIAYAAKMKRLYSILEV